MPISQFGSDLANFFGGLFGKDDYDFTHIDSPSSLDGAGDIISGLNDAINASERDFAISTAKTAMDFEAAQAELNRQFQQSSAREAMEFEAGQAELNRQWQQEMSNTAYQRAVADLKAAGLNPILAYQQGGAATTSGAMASGQSAAGSSAAGHKATTSGKNVIDIASQLIASTARAFAR